MKSTLFAWRSLRTRLTLLTLLVFLLGLWPLAFYTSQALRQDMQRLMGEQQFLAVSLVADSINHELDERLQTLKTVAAGIDPGLLKNPAALQRALEQRPDLQSLFNGGVLVLNPEGTTITGVPQEAARPGISDMDHNYVPALLKDGTTAVGQPVLDKVSRAAIFCMVVGLRNAQGQVVGALAGVTDLGKSNFLDDLIEGHYGMAGGHLIVAPKSRLKVTASAKLRVMETLPAPGVNPMIDRAIDGYEGSGVGVNPLGQEVLSSQKKIPLADWIIVTSLPTEQAFAPIDAMLRRLLVSTLLFTLLAASLILWVSSRMVRRQLAPLLATTRTLSGMSTGKQPPQALQVTSQDEIGELIAGFNCLLASLAERESQIRQLAFHDPLTQLPNRRLLEDRLGQALTSSKRNACWGALMFLDLDIFKPLNDRHGHGLGDLLLIEVAVRLKICVREIDTVARVGGDEFVVLLSELTPDQAESGLRAHSIAEKIRASLAQAYLLTKKQDEPTDSMIEHHCTASIGVVLFFDHQASQTEYLKWADEAMYQAKEAGRNTIRFHDPKTLQTSTS